ncbi:MAG: permease-like cell division protein FtsX [Bacteroidota bacterium]
MQLSYVLKEGFSGFKRAKLSMVAAVVTIAVSLLLLSFFSILLINANTVVNSLRDRVEMEAFIGDHLSQDDITNLKIQIELLEGVQQARLITKEEAAAIFKEEFGEDIYKVLNFNPLPASFKIFLKDGYKTSVSAERVFAQLKSLKGVDDVIYRKQLLEMLDQKAMTFLWFTFGIGVFIAVSSIVLVANTIRLAIYSKRKIIQTMKLIGATRGFIRTPFILEGLIQGVLGGGFAAAVVFVVFNYLERWVSIQLSDFVRVAPVYYGVILGVGCLLGVLGSLFSVRKFISESVVS